jgi:hypothetical protein
MLDKQSLYKGHTIKVKKCYTILGINYMIHISIGFTN